MRHLFEEWQHVEPAIASASRLLLLLDFDGTLSPIVRHPGEASLPLATRQTLERLATALGVRLAVISGRAANDVRQKVGMANIDYVGNHGRERIRAGEAAAQADAATREKMAAVAKAFSERLGALPGILIEDKGLTVAVHYRRVPDELHPEVRKAVEQVEKRFAGAIRFGEGNRVFDVVPADDANKGKAGLALLDEEGGLPDVLPIYCGDDATDETAFAALPAEALTVAVGDETKESLARYRLDDPEQVAAFLERILVARGVQPA